MPHVECVQGETVRGDPHRVGATGRKPDGLTGIMTVEPFEISPRRLPWLAAGAWPPAAPNRPGNHSGPQTSACCNRELFQRSSRKNQANIRAGPANRGEYGSQTTIQ